MRTAWQPGRCLALTLLIGLSGSASAGDWPGFRGPRYDGISTETGLTTAWKGPIPLLWQRDLGSSYSSFACVGRRVFTCGTKDKNQVLYCLDADTGKTLWQTAIEAHYPSNYGSGTRATPTVRDGLVYILGAHGRLLCVSADDGAEVWSRRLNNKPTWGYSGSVLIEGDLAIATGGGGDGTLVALDRRTGEPVWTCGDEPAGYAMPYPFTFGGRRYVVGMSGNSAVIADARTGGLALRIPWKTSFGVNAAMPIVHDERLLLTSGYGTGCAVFELRPDGAKLAADVVWKSKALRNKFQSCILHEGKLYTSDQKALKCVDFLTGAERWNVPRVRHGTLVLADEHLFLLTEKGELQIARASPESFSPRTRADIFAGKCWTVPVIHNGRLYARSLNRVACFDLKPKP